MISTGFATQRIKEDDLQKKIAKYERMKKELEIEKERLIKERMNMGKKHDTFSLLADKNMIFYLYLPFFAMLLLLILIFLKREKRFKKNNRQEVSQLQNVMKELIEEVGRYIEKAPNASDLGDLVLKADTSVKKMNKYVEKQKDSREDNRGIDADTIYSLYKNGTDKLTISRRYNLSLGEVDFIIKLKHLKERDAGKQ